MDYIIHCATLTLRLFFLSFTRSGIALNYFHISFFVSVKNFFSVPVYSVAE